MVKLNLHDRMLSCCLDDSEWTEFIRPCGASQRALYSLASDQLSSFSFGSLGEILFRVRTSVDLRVPGRRGPASALAEQMTGAHFDPGASAAAPEDIC